MDSAYDHKSFEATDENLGKTGKPVVPSVVPTQLEFKFEGTERKNWQIASHPLSSVYADAVAQATQGKGKERHGKGKDFLSQPWVEIANTHGIGFLTGQAEKKLREAIRNTKEVDHVWSLCDHAWWEKEMLGALNYLAMAILYKRGIK